MNFSMKSFELAHCQKLAELTLTKSRYIALLVSLHIDFLYGKEKNENAAAKKFLEEQKQLQTQWLKQLQISRQEALRIYELVEWCDALSLLICKGDMQPEERKVEISTGPDKNMYSLSQADESTLCVDPWPFEVESFDVRYDTRMISKINFDSTEQLRQSLLAAEPEEKKWRIAKRKKKSK